jgi:enoyl-[acyl-carrier protein] reductase II
MNRVLAHCGGKVPILQAPMGWISRSRLAGAVSRAGGLGIVETSSGETEACIVEIGKMRDTGLPFGVNLPICFLRDEAMLRSVCASGVRFVTGHRFICCEFFVFREEDQAAAAVA